ncbi:MAG: hypothetical protein QM286_13685 [Acidobacteriota bacterium]|nr:hypothetical protein [Acidobacteriota bacterium]
MFHKGTPDSERAIAPAVGVSFQQVAKDQVSPDATPQPGGAITNLDERVDPVTGVVVPPPSYKPTDVTGWDPEDVDDMLARDDLRHDRTQGHRAARPGRLAGRDAGRQGPSGDT